MPRTTEIASKNLKPGVNYRMVHSRKGEAVVKCEEPAPDGGTFIVIEGELRGIHDFYGPGDRFTTVNNLAKFYREKPTTAKNVKQRTTKPIPMEEFGKDHWSTFAYVETLVVEGEQPRRERMRCDADRHPQFAHGEFKDKFPTRTKKGEVKNHDDWDCLDDCELVGLRTRARTCTVSTNSRRWDGQSPRSFASTRRTAVTSTASCRKFNYAPSRPEGGQRLLVLNLQGEAQADSGAPDLRLQRFPAPPRQVPDRPVH